MSSNCKPRTRVSPLYRETFAHVFSGRKEGKDSQLRSSSVVVLLPLLTDTYLPICKKTVIKNEFTVGTVGD